MSLIVSKMPINRQHHGSKGRTAADEVGNWLRHKYARYPQPANVGKEEGQRHDNDDLAEEREENRPFGHSQRLKHRLTRKLQRHKEKSKEIHMKSGNAQPQHLRVIVKDADEKLREPEHQPPHRQRNENAGDRHKPNGPF